VCAVILGGGCVTRPVGSNAPTTKTTVMTPLTATKISKVDLLFAIDNSASMGDKQALLKDAVPDLIQRLVTPMCIDPDDPTKVLGPSRGNGSCAAGELEFTPITDLHVGIVSSSLGGVGSASCPPSYSDATFPQAVWHEDDRGELVARASGAAAQDDAKQGFLAWTPSGPGAASLVGDVQDLVVGVGQYGCGFEAQEESWYRFLVQPDPYDGIDTSSGTATLMGVDEKLLAQRKAFLRPDSLVAIIQITDENESTVDPRSVGGSGYMLENPGAGTAPRATAACASNPNDPACISCGFTGIDTGAHPECKNPILSPDEDQPNERFFHMKQRFGVDPMYPASRYTRGLGVDPAGGHATTVVPDRDGEHAGRSAYADRAGCTNPLFAADLPGSAKDDLCKLAPGPRTPDLVFYAAITGVPGDLVPQSGAPSDADWTRMIGKAPLAYDFTGADPRMLESIEPRPGVAGDRDTHGGDLQYACTFDLAQPKTCDKNDPACDCRGAPGPLCDPANPDVQVRAKAYPGIRHLSLARSLGKNGVAASICPEDTKDPSPTNARYGYRPAMRAIADRLSLLLGGGCLPRAPKPDATGKAPCLVLEAMTGEVGGDDACDRPDQGLSRADPAVLASFRREQAEAGNDLSRVPLCEKVQLTEPGGTRCTTDPRAGWCFVEGGEALTATRRSCTSAILFSPKGQPASGHTAYLQCIED
jgi:hypothetical protein